jgi:hypothetical protein
MQRVIGISRDRQQKNTLGILTLGSLALQAVNIVVLAILASAYMNMSRKPAPAMVQLTNGEAIAMSPLSSKERIPAVIQKFTKETMTLLLSASGTIPGSGDQAASIDPGIPVKTADGEKKISSLAHIASFGLSEDFRAKFLEGLATRTPPSIFSGQAQVVLVIQDISMPVKIGDGSWKVTMIANQVTINSQQIIGSSIPFNKEIFVRSVTHEHQAEYDSELEQRISEVRQGGLEIYSIRNYTRPNPTQ